VRVLVVNVGSSSLKLRLLDERNTIERSADLPAGPDGFVTTQLAAVLGGWDEPDAVATRHPSGAYERCPVKSHQSSERAGVVLPGSLGLSVGFVTFAIVVVLVVCYRQVIAVYPTVVALHPHQAATARVRRAWPR
jgi:acetate kinase